jgi:hypothetical protein
MKTFKNIVLIWVALIITAPAISCTTAIISGKYTKDGRPILWKHRDTDFLQNKLMYFSDGKYNYIGLINSEDKEGTQVWAGTNSTGFAIMNAALYDVNLENPINYKDREGYVMKKALQQCATLEDFEQMLDKMDKPLGVASSFGVIDAQGGAAYYEVDNQNFVKYDVNDPKFAPNGYIIRSNYSYRGQKDKGYGYIRYQNAQKHFFEADASGNLNLKTIVQKFSRSAYHSLLNKDYKQIAMNSSKKPHFINAGDLIVRNSSSSAVVFHGVKKDESPDHTTMWTLLGYPFTTVACPVWVKGGDNLPEILTGKEETNAPLCEWAMTLKQKAYPIQRGSGYKYLNITALYNKQETGIAQKLNPVEDEIFKRAREYQAEWRNSGINKNEIDKFYTWLNNYLTMNFDKILKLDED